MNQEIKDQIFKKIIAKQREAYELIKDLKTKTDPIVSYVVSTEIKIQGGNYTPIITIKELPEVRISHDLPGSEEEFLKNVDIDNMEG